MTVSGIEGFAPLQAPQVAATPVAAPPAPTAPMGPSGVAGAGSVDGPSFGSMLTDGLERLDAVQHRSDDLAVRAATGDLQSLHDYTIAATESAVTTQLTVALRNKAVEAFNEIMRMQV